MATRSCRTGAWYAVVAAALLPAAARGVPINLDFDAAYMVAASGSTEAVTSFDVDGPAPWLYLDLPDGALNSFSSSVTSRWFAGSSTSAQFAPHDGFWGAKGKYWLSPSSAEWEASKAVGQWHVDASHALVQLVIIYGGGAPVVWARGDAIVSFSVASRGMPGDFNFDARVDADDLSGAGGWQQRFGSSLEGDDLLMWQRQVADDGPLGATAQTVPEPAAVALATLGAGILVACQRRPRS